MKTIFYLAFVLISGTALPLYSVAQISNTFSIGITGDPADVTTPTEAGTVLMGGSTDVDEALQWMIKRSGGGDFVIIRASGSTGYNNYIDSLGKVNSVETLMIDTREKAMSSAVGNRIREAEALFIAGGDQANYVKYWTNSEVSAAIRYLIEEKHVPIGGTSAGCAVLSGIAFDALHDTAISKDVLADPYHEQVSLSASFIKAPFLENTISDQHYAQREREGRHVTFMARMISDFGIAQPKGIGVNEKTAVCIDKAGNASVFGSGKAFFIISNGGKPEYSNAGKPLSWTNNHKALRVYAYNATPTGTKAFNLAQWRTDTPDEIWYVESGRLTKIAP